MRSTRLTALAFLALAAVACGQGGSGSSETASDSESADESGIGSDAGIVHEDLPESGTESASGLPSDLAVAYEEVERCANLRAPEPGLILDGVRPCPMSGRMCCIASVPDFKCGLLNLLTCGAAGYYDEDAMVIHLPEGCSLAFRHEAVHHLLYANGRADWKSHNAAEFRCQ